MAQRQILMLCGFSALIGALAAVYVTGEPHPSWTTSAQEPGQTRPTPSTLVPVTPPPAPDYQGLTEEETVHVRVYEAVNRSVVNISTKSVHTDGYFMFEVPSEGAGSGVVIDKQGRVVTNYHVIEDARQIQVTLFDGTSYDAEVLGIDRTTDIAVLLIEAPAESLFPVVFGDSSSLLVGQRVYAIGNPFGLERTLSTGIIASLNRQLPSPMRNRRMEHMIQIDADINPGNSGGPLLNTSGRMIGINQAIASKTQESAGIGFAIPINTIARIVPQLIQNGRIVRGDIGILSVYPASNGLRIVKLLRGGAAERAGLRGPKYERRQRRQGPVIFEYTEVDQTAADLIVGVDGQPVSTVEELVASVESHQPGERVTVNIIRDGQQLAVPVVLDADD
jgi:S1-C subfamily serine protease